MTTTTAEAASRFQRAAQELFANFLREYRADDAEAAEGLLAALKGGATFHVESTVALSGFKQIDLAMTLPSGERHHLATIEDAPSIAAGALPN